MKLTDRARGVKVYLAAASRKLWVKASKTSWKDDWSNWTSLTLKYWRGEWAQASPSRVYLAAAVSAAFLFTASYIAVQHMNQTGAWNRVYTNGSYVGMVPNDQEVIASMRHIAEGYNVNVEFFPVHTTVSGNYNWTRVAGLPTSGVAILVDGKPAVYTHSQSAAQEVLADLKRLLAVPRAKDTQVSFVERVALAPVEVSVTEILQPSSALHYLLRPNPGQSSGRAASAIPISFMQSQLPKTAPVKNPSVNNGPVISVQTLETTTQTHRLEFSVHYQSTNQLGLGQIKVVQQGAPGVVKEVVKMRYINGRLVSQQVLSKHVLKAPKPEIAERGTNAGVASGSWVWPTTAYDVTSPFGWRDLFGSPNFHPGVDLGCPIGTPIYATNNGVVEDAGWNSGGYGIWVKINNGDGIETVFGHMSQVVAHSGETVAKGQLLGYSGETGFATGPHLHYEVRLNGTPVNPGPYM